MRHIATVVLVSFAVAACATTPASGPSAPTGPASIPSTPLSLGDWRSASAAATLSGWEQAVSARYGAGLALDRVAADLRSNEFQCGPNQRRDGRGDPAAEVCRRTITASGCTHTWQVHLFDAGGDRRLARTRGLYDRRCGSDGLLGGPG